MYRKINADVIQRLSDGEFIPCNPEHRHYIEFLQWQEEGGVIDETDPLRDAIPQEVTAGQAYAALMAAGLYDMVVAWADDPDTDPLHRLAFQRGSTFRRDSPALAAGCTALGWDENTLDQLFIEAAKIQL